MENISKSTENTKDIPVDKIKRRTLKIDDGETFLEGNLIEIPFISTNRRIVNKTEEELKNTDNKSKTKKELICNVEYSWIDSNKIKRGIEVRGSSKYGVPTTFELSVLLALFRIYAKNKEFISDETGKLNIPIDIKFSFAEIAREMGYNSYCGQIKNRIEEAIEILLDTTIYSKFNGALYDTDKEEYVINVEGKKGIHILEDYVSYSYKEAKLKNEKRIAGKNVKNHTMVRINNFFYKSIQNGYYTILDNDKYNELKSNIAKRLYTLLKKWSVTRLKYETLVERIPLDKNKENKYNKKLIKKALEELKRCDCISDYVMDKEGVNFYFKGKTSAIYYYRDKFNTDEEIVGKLHDSGISYEDITRYVRLDNRDYIKALLRYCTYTEHKKGIKKNAFALLQKGLKKPYKNIDNNFYDL